MKYVDNEDEACNVTGELELREAFHAKKQEVLKLELSFRKKNKQPQNQSPFPMPQRRVCWPERINQRRVQLVGLGDEGIALMNAKKFEEAKVAFEKQIEMIKCPWKKSCPLYNIACCEALLGNTDSALAFLAQAIAHGYRNVSHVEQDEDLVSLHGLDAFDVMLAELRSTSQKQEKDRNQNGCRRWEGHWRRGMDCEVKPVQVECKFFSPVPNCPVPVPEPSTLSTPVVLSPVPENVTTDVVEPKLDSPLVLPPVSPVMEEQIAQPLFEPIGINSYEVERNALLQMGFTNEKRNLRALMKTKGNLSEAVVLLLR